MMHGTMSVKFKAVYIWVMADAIVPRVSFLSFRWLSKNLKVKVHKTIILHAVLYGCVTRSPTLREEK